ncbi:hypothetical protein TNCV_5105601 [Trichonephila clavipes]|nr:hypothetical protein TNCV_5105601 [Trichonephila clavipes]
MLRPMALPFIRAQRNLTLRQDNARPHAANLSPTENVWSRVAERLACHYTPVTMVDELWQRLKAAWSSVPLHAIQSLFDSMSKHISALIIARGGSEY